MSDSDVVDNQDCALVGWDGRDVGPLLHHSRWHRRIDKTEETPR
jgi:hypothetical protein